MFIFDSDLVLQMQFFDYLKVKNHIVCRGNFQPKMIID